MQHVFLLQILRQSDATNDIFLYFAIKSESKRQRSGILAVSLEGFQLMHGFHRDQLEAVKF